MLRIAGGTAKGLKLKVPPVPSLRPTSERVRSALFSLIAARLQTWDLVLDLYAGSGALGIESLSWGAQWVDFVDSSARCCAMIKENLLRGGFASRAQVYCMKVEKVLAVLNNRYDLVLMDPPYAEGTSVEPALAGVHKLGLLRPGALIAVEHSSRLSLPVKMPGLSLNTSRRYGDTSISIYDQEAPQ